MDTLLRAYATLVEKHALTLEQVPEKYREAVENYDPSLDVTDIPDPEPGLNGALTLKPLHVEYDLNTFVYNEDLFTPDLLGDLPMPENMTYSIRRVENVYGAFAEDVEITIDPISTGFVIKLAEEPINVQEHRTVLRIDMIISSSNYEDMLLTVYMTK